MYSWYKKGLLYIHNRTLFRTFFNSQNTAFKIFFLLLIIKISYLLILIIITSVNLLFMLIMIIENKKREYLMLPSNVTY